jgi:hypothetical protein
MRLIGLFAVVLPNAGCQPLGYKQMTEVAKDWCLSIRADQVVPVYPLTEDLEPGDVFLVQLSVDEQQKAYITSGFLPLEDHRHRINLSSASENGITELYFDGFFKDEFGTPLPHPRPSRNASAGGLTTSPSGTTQPVFTEIAAPRAAFPTYSFSANRGGGLSLAIPVHAVPIAFNYMGADKATGTIQLLDAHTFASDTYYLEHELRAWAQLSDVHQSLVDAVALNGGKPVFLRVVSRVYLIGGVAVSLTNADSSGANLTVGKGVSATQPSSTEYKDLLSSLSSQAQTTLPVGGSVQFTQASSMGVSMNEMFDHPLAVGYLGFDVAVDRNGSIGPRVPTFDVLENRKQPIPAAFGVFVPDQEAHAVSMGAFKGLAANPNGIEQQLELIDRMGQLLADEPFPALGKAAAAQLSATPRPASFQAEADKLLTQFENASLVFVSLDGQSGPHYRSFDDAFKRAFTGN